MTAQKDFQTTLDSLKSRGYWRVNLYPAVVKQETLQTLAPAEAKNLAQSASIQLRGWDYPHYPTETREYQDLYIVSDRIEAWIDWEGYKEIWRLYASGQFIQFLGLREDWYRERSSLMAGKDLSAIEPQAALSVIGTTYSITEMFLFLRNLVEASLYDEGVMVDISLHNTLDRKLELFERRRAPLMMDYRCRGDVVKISTMHLAKDEVVTDYLELAQKVIIRVFEQFNWETPPLSVIREDQKNLVERRM